MTRNAQDIIDDMRNIVKPRIEEMLLEANFEGCGKEDKAEFETEFEMILTLAEKALEKEPCEDAVSRQAVLDGLASIAKAKAKSDAQKSLMGRVMFFVEQLPPVTPQHKMGRWIPVSESLPEENESVMASTELGVFPETRYSKKYGWEWAYEAGENYWRALGYKVTAWMPLPEPYKPQEDKE